MDPRRKVSKRQRSALLKRLQNCERKLLETRKDLKRTMKQMDLLLEELQTPQRVIRATTSKKKNRSSRGRRLPVPFGMSRAPTEQELRAYKYANLIAAAKYIGEFEESLPLQPVRSKHLGEKTPSPAEFLKFARRKIKGALEAYKVLGDAPGTVKLLRSPEAEYLTKDDLRDFKVNWLQRTRPSPYIYDLDRMGAERTVDDLLKRKDN